MSALFLRYLYENFVFTSAQVCQLRNHSPLCPKAETNYVCKLTMGAGDCVLIVYEEVEQIIEVTQGLEESYLPCK